MSLGWHFEYLGTNMLYSAFVSYSHAADGKLVPALQRALHTFNKPWYKLRALRVFRDKTSLSANPALWSAIELALSQSEWFLFMASPQAAQSPWVQREIAWWVQHRTCEKMLILLTDGDLIWDETANDFNWDRTSAAPTCLAGQFAGEPLYVDLRWAKTEENLSLRHAQFRAALLDIAAPIHGRAKDDLDGEDVRQYRKTRRLTRIVISLLVLLTTSALTAAYLAVQQRNTAALNLAKSELNLAEALGREALSLVTNEHRELDAFVKAIKAGKILRDQYTTNPVVMNALQKALNERSERNRFIGHQDYVCGVAITPDGKTVVSGSYDRTIKVWSLEQRGEEPRTLTGHQYVVCDVAITPDGKTLVSSGEDNTIQVWDLDFDSLMRRSCDWVLGYLENPYSDVSKGDRHLCDGIGER